VQSRPVVGTSKRGPFALRQGRYVPSAAIALEKFDDQGRLTAHRTDK
jgi:hypothetical protein